jgi:glyoxylase-like metal-dependent hydrolase (beta-lactamase superfamily II)
MRTTLLHPATFKLDGGAMFGIIPKPLWEKKIKPDEFNRINMSLRVVLFETANRKILIDTGLGDYHSEKFNQQFDVQSSSSPLVKALDAVGLKAQQITDIVITHLHFDHVGGLGQGEKGCDIIFPNATIHLHAKHLEYAHNPTLRDAGSFHNKTFMPLIDYYRNKNQFNLIEAEEGLILQDGPDKLNYKISFGHTPYMLHPYNDHYIYMADLVPMGHHFNIPWVMGYDIEPGVTTVYKQKFYEFIYDKKLTMIFEHDIESWGAKIGLDEQGKMIMAKLNKSSGVIVEKLEIT